MIAKAELLYIFLAIQGGPAGMVFTLSNGIVSDVNIKCLGASSATTTDTAWTTAQFDDRAWPASVVGLQFIWLDLHYKFMFLKFTGKTYNNFSIKISLSKSSLFDFTLSHPLKLQASSH